jgi:hypothetical protein
MLVVVSVLGCQTHANDSYLPASQKDALNLQGPYLGQQLPGIVPVLFPPAVLGADSAWFFRKSAPAFTFT